MEKVLADGDEIRTAVLKNLTKANTEIILAMAFFTDEEIAQALVEKSKEKISVKVIIAGNRHNTNVINILSESNCQVTVLEQEGYGMMHHKFCVIDDSTVMHGSYNYTRNAAKNNKEALNITDSYQVVKEYKKIFKEMEESSTDLTQTEKEMDYTDKFTNELNDHIKQIFSQYNEKETLEKGRKRAENSNSNVTVFETFMETIFGDYSQKLFRDEATKEIIKSRLNGSYNRAAEANLQFFDSKERLLKSNFSSKKEELNAKISPVKEQFDLKHEQLMKIKNEEEKLEFQVEGLEEEKEILASQIYVEKFWTFKTFFKTSITLILFAYLSLFFSSAFWKIFFEKATVQQLLLQGIVPDQALLFDAYAWQNIFYEKGAIYGIISLAFFLLPVLLISVKLYSNSKFIHILIGYVVALIAIDVTVSFLISQNNFEINALLTGSAETWEPQSALRTGEFWMIFIFGALPLFITKLLIESLNNSYLLSKPEKVNHAKHLEKQRIQKKQNRIKVKLLEEKQKRENMEQKLELLKNQINGYQEQISELTIETTKASRDNEEKRIEKEEKLREVYNRFLAMVDSGSKEILENLVQGPITTFKEGFILHLTAYYAPIQVEKRIKDLEDTQKRWFKDKFSKD